METPAEFIGALKHLRAQAGSPSLRDIERLSRKYSTRLPPSSTSDLLRSNEAPPVRSVIAFVIACREYAAELDIALAGEQSKHLYWQNRLMAIQLDGSAEPAPPTVEPIGPAASQTGPIAVPRRGSRYVLLANSLFDNLPALPGIATTTPRYLSALDECAPWLDVSLERELDQPSAQRIIEKIANETLGVLFLHWSTHGLLDPRGRLMLATSETNDRMLGLSADLVVDILARRSRPSVLILEASYAGTASMSLGRYRSSKVPLGVLSCCGPLEQCWDGDMSLTASLTDELSSGSDATEAFLSLSMCVDAIRRRHELVFGPRASGPRVDTVGGPAENIALACNVRQVILA